MVVVGDDGVDVDGDCVGDVDGDVLKGIPEGPS